jgi:hypothetical protein
MRISHPCYHDHLGEHLLALVALALVASCGACGSGSSSSSAAITLPPDLPTFDSTQAFSDLQAQCAFGPRTPGSAAHAQQLAWMQAQLAPLAGRVVEQPFTTSTSFGGPYDFDNLVAVFDETAPGPITMVLTHWDTRAVSDEDPLPANQSLPSLGANDGASGVAVLLELARLLHARPAPHPVYLVFVDAEDTGTPGSPLLYEGWCLGTTYLAQHWPTGLARPTQGILLDLVGGVAQHDARLGDPRGAVDYLDLPVEGFSSQFDPTLVNHVWTLAGLLAAPAFRRAVGGEIIDDHLPFNAVGIPTIDVIQNPFPPVWHTLDDTPQYCQASALNQVGETMVAQLYSP